MDCRRQDSNTIMWEIFGKAVSSGFSPMLNESLFNSSVSNQSQPSLDQLLDSLGFVAWKTIIASFVLPIISFIGIFLCSLSLWTFFHKNFKDPVFFYYRLLCIVYIIHLFHNLPFAIVFSPRYLPQIDTFWCSVYLIYNGIFSGFLFHFEETLQFAILLTRITIYNSFVKKYFTAKPWKISLIFFLICLLIDFPSAFSFKISSYGFFQVDNSLFLSKQNLTFFYFTASDFSSTAFGRIFLTLTVSFLNLFLSIIIGIILNVVALLLFRSHVKGNKLKNEEYARASYSRRNQVATLSKTNEKLEMTMNKTKKIAQKEIRDYKVEKNMLQMALTLCSISILSRILIIFVYVFFLFSDNGSDISDRLILIIITNSFYTWVPTSVIFIFYSFNKMFRQRFRKEILFKVNS